MITAIIISLITGFVLGIIATIKYIQMLERENDLERQRRATIT